MGKEDVVISIGVDMAALQAAVTKAQSVIAQAFGASGKSAGAFGVTINNVTKTTVSNTAATRQQVNALKVQQAQHNATAAAAKAQTAQINAQTAALRNQMAQARATARQAGGNQAVRNPRGGAMGQAGNAAMQVQDIAVSLQGGMSGLQVMGQQGSQLLSIFGPGGALAGGAIAVGAALATGIYGGQKAFESFIDTAREVNMELQGIAKFGNSTQVFSGLEAAAEQMKNISAEVDKFSGFMGGVRGTFANIGGKFGGKSELEQRIEFAARQVEMEKTREQLAQRSIVLGQKDLELTKARAVGDKDRAEALERQAATEERLFDLFKRKGLTVDEKSKLRDQIKLSSEIESAYAEEKRASEIMAAAEKKQDDQQRKSEEEKIDALREFEKAQKEQFEQFQKDTEKQADFVRRREKEIADEKRKFFDAVQDANEKRLKDEAKQAKRNADDLREQGVRLEEIAIERSGKGKSAIEIAKIELEFREKIKDALEKENHALAQKLAQERDILKHEEAINEQLKSPEQKKKERDEQKEREKADRIVRSRERRKAQAAQQAGFGGFVDDKGKPAKAVPNLQPNAPAAGAAGGGAGNAMKVDTLVVKVLKHG